MEKKYKKFHHLTYNDRLKIEKMKNGGSSIQEIADALRVNYTTIYRELKRPGVMYEHLHSDYSTEERYSADKAQDQYEYNKTAKGRPIKLGNDHKLAKYIERKIINEKRSPAALLMDIKNEKKCFKVSICEKTIYNYIAAGVFLHLTNKDLPERGERKRTYKKVRQTRVPKGESIERRPEQINTRTEYGHWEMDTVKGTKYSKKCILVLTERMSRQEITLPMNGATAENVVASINMLERKWGTAFGSMFKTITVDNGSEFANCKGIEESIYGGSRTKVYYCHPYSSYERGSNECLNKMLRRIFPKGTNFDNVDDEAIVAASEWMNNYPREILGGKTAAMVYNDHIAQLHR